MMWLNHFNDQVWSCLWMHWSLPSANQQGNQNPSACHCEMDKNLLMLSNLDPHYGGLAWLSFHHLLTTKLAWRGTVVWKERDAFLGRDVVRITSCHHGRQRSLPLCGTQPSQPFLNDSESWIVPRLFCHMEFFSLGNQGWGGRKLWDKPLEREGLPLPPFSCVQCMSLNTHVTHINHEWWWLSRWPPSSIVECQPPIQHL